MEALLDIKFPRPAEGDCASYYFRYINLVPAGDVEKYLQEQQATFSDFIGRLTDTQLAYQYAPGKWTLAELIGHVLDTERIFAYRMLAISRGEKKELPGFEQVEYVLESKYNGIPAQDLKAEWNAIRESSLWLCRHMTAEMASRAGTASNHHVVAYCYPYILAGHVNHHLKVAQERYLAHT